MLSIRTNLSSFIAKNSLQTSTNNLNQAIERMTTGAKLNHAKDTAANYSIATDMLTKISAYDVAADNVAMGMDMVTTMSDTLELLNDHASRIRDLCEQASNGTYGEESLKAIQSEIDARLAEIERIKSNAEYNGIKLFEGGDSNVNNYAETSVPFLKPITRLTEEEAIAQGYTLVTNETELINALNNNESICLMNDIDMNTTYTYNGHIISVYSNAIIEGNGYSIKNIKTAMGSHGTSFIGEATNITIKNLSLDYEDTTGAYGGSLLFLNSFGDIIVENCAFTGDFYGQYGYQGLGGISSATTFTMKDSYVNLSSLIASSHVAYYSLGPSSVAIDISNCYFNKDVINDTSSAGGVTSAELDAILAAAQVASPIGSGNGQKSISLQVGINSNSDSQIVMSLESLKALGAIDATSSDSARSALSTLDEYINSIGKLQTNLGSVSNRLESVLDEILIQHDNLVSSRSTIRDADIAEVSSQYIQQQILQQASATLLSSAQNIQAQNVLGLLQSLR